jgi:N-methylhydantoinase A
MQSSGGVMGAEAAAVKPINIIESGPAAGVVGAAEIAKILDLPNILTFDMGGTTAKACLIEGGRFGRLPALDVGGGINLAGRLLAGAGYTVRVPAVDIAEVGAGGGSLVVSDPGGSLRVGPESAGAVPGPVCYDQGGNTVTVTDANVVLGFLNSRYLAGGDLPLNYDKAVRALNEQIAGPLGISVEEAAWGVHSVANSVMARALNAVSTERGRDPREFALMAFGGNGAVHGPTLARSLDMKTVMVPPVPGLFSAIGLLFPPTEHHYVRTYKRRLDLIDFAATAAAFGVLEAECRQALRGEGYSDEYIAFQRSVDMRYEGENFELTVPYPNTGDIHPQLRESFEQLHEQAYGYRARLSIEIMNLRVAGRGLSNSSTVPTSIRTSPIRVAPRQAPDRRVYFGKNVGWTRTPIINSRHELDKKGRMGPLIVEEYDATTVVPPDCHIRLDHWDMLVIEIGANR